MLKNPDFLVIPYQVIDDKRLRPTDQLVYGVVYWLENLRDGRCTASDRTIGEVCKVGAGTVANGLTRLEKCGYIQRVRNENGERMEIKTLVSFRKVAQLMNGVSTNDEVGGSTNDEQNNNHSIRKVKRNKASAEADAGLAGKKKSKWQKDTPMSRKDFIFWAKKSPQRHIQIIAEWAEAEGPEYETYGQWQSFISRNSRVAGRLAVFSMKQIEDAYTKMWKDVKSKKNPDGFITKYSLETLEKYI